MTDGVATETRPPDADHPIRVRLLEAAARVFARQGYEGTRIMDVVREAGLSTGAAYGRFRSKGDLLRAAVVERAGQVAWVGDGAATRVADLIARLGSVTTGRLTDDEAVRLEAFVAARREPEVARAITEAAESWRAAVQPLVDAAVADGTISADVDPEAVLFLLRAVGLGLLLQRGAGLPGPDPESWRTVVTRVVASFGEPTVTPSETTKEGTER